MMKKFLVGMIWVSAFVLPVVAEDAAPDIKQLALGEVARQGGRTNDTEITIRTMEDGNLGVMVERMRPRVPGGHNGILMTPGGEVIRFQRGR